MSQIDLRNEITAIYRHLAALTIAAGADPTSLDSLKAELGLDQVDNVSDLDKPLSTAAIAALLGKQDTLVSGTNIKSINDSSLLGAGNLLITGVKPGEWALQLLKDNVGHINHGAFHLPGVTYTSFYWEMMVETDGTGQYIISDGYGGAHCILVGVDAPSNGVCTISGNVFYDGVSTSFGTTVDGIRVGSPAHVAIAGDAAAQKITIIINGVPCSITPWTSGTRRTAAETDSQLFIGGSDHQPFSGYIWKVRGFENTLPYANPAQTVVRPADDFMSWSIVRLAGATIAPCFIADYTTGLFIDHSDGLAGVRHNGVPVETVSAGNAGGTGYDYLQAGNRDPSKRPQLVKRVFAYSGGATPATPTVGARIFDSFGRTDVHRGNSATLGLGSTEVGDKAWTNSANYGILHGKVYPATTAPGITYVDDTAADYTLRISKPTAAVIPTGLGIVYGAAFNISSTGDYNVLVVDEYGFATVQQYVGGAYTGHLGGFAFGTGWQDAAVTVTGTEVKVYNGATLKATQTMTQNTAGRKKGMFMNHPTARIDKIEVI